MIEAVRNIFVPAERAPEPELVIFKEEEGGSHAMRENPAKYNAVALDFPSSN